MPLPDPRPVVVRAPATSANLGPGFDCLGLALDLWNEVEALPGGADPEADRDNLILRAARAVFDTCGAPFPGFALRCANRVPFGRGLGSSAAALCCGVLLANRSLGDPLDQGACLRLASALEGHPDNVVPCLLGGVQVATLDAKGGVVHARVRLGAALSVVVFVPDHRVPTEQARRVLPRQVPMADALFNVARASLLVAALSEGRLDLLAEATRDRLHQPYRLPLFPAGGALLDAAVRAGALAAYTSGAGPSVVALCRDEDGADLEAALSDAAARLDVDGAPMTLAMSPVGAHVVPPA